MYGSCDQRTSVLWGTPFHSQLHTYLTILIINMWCITEPFIMSYLLWSIRMKETQVLNILFESTHKWMFVRKNNVSVKVEKIVKDSLDSISSPSPSVKIQIMGRKVCLRCKGKTLLGIVNKLLKTKSLLTSPNNVLPHYLK